MVPNHKISHVLETLHYTTPVVVLACFFIARTVATCFLHRPSRNGGDRNQRLLSLLSLLAVVVTFIAQAVVYFAQSLIQRGFWANQDNVIYILASVFAYSWLLLSLHEQKTPVWYPYGVAFTFATAFEIPTTVLGALILPKRDDFAFSRLCLQVARSFILVVLSLSYGWYAFHDQSQSSKDDEDENEPLLSNGADGNANKPHYGAANGNDDDHESESSGDMDSWESEPEEYRKVKEQQRKRLREAGSWINYLKEFKIFIPMLWPSRNRLVQFCLVVIGVVLVTERFLNVLVPRQLGIIVDELTKDNGHGYVPWRALILWMVFAYLQSFAGIYVIQALAQMPVEQFAYRALNVASFKHIMGLSMDFHNEKNTGELIRAVDQGSQLQRLLDFVCFRVAPIFLDITVALIYVSQLFDVYMSFILGVVGIGYIWVGAKTTVWSIKRRRRLNFARRNESKVQNEAISNWQTVSHFNRGQYECDRYEKSIIEFNSAEMSYYFAYEVGSAAQTLVMILGRLAATFLAVYRVSQGVVPVGNLVTLTSYWYSIEGPLSEVSWQIRQVTQMLTDSERLLQLFQAKPSVADAPGAVDIEVKEGHVEFRHVEFSYDPRKPTLKDVSFVAKPGQTVALCGETGGGKSTIMKLLYRYYDVSSGSILIDGQDIRGVTLDSLREIFGMVPQDPALFNVSIMENLRYARLDATEDEIKDACRAAAIHDKIETFPDGYESTVGERGVKLSGGEMQRVSIARAILRQPKIVLLDEATSMIDAETESTIQKAFRQLSATRTTFVIAHRLATIQHADVILVIQDGEIIEHGTHDELIRNKNGKYVSLWSKQLSKDVQAIGQTLRDGEGEQTLIELDDAGETSDARKKRD